MLLRNLAVTALALLTGCELLLPLGRSDAPSTAPDARRRPPAAEASLVLDAARDRSSLEQGVLPDRGPLFTGTNLTDDGTGSWSASGSQLTGDSCPLFQDLSPDAWVAGASWADVAVTARLKVSGTCLFGAGEAGLVVRVKSASACDNQYYWCGVSLFYGDLALGRVSGSCTTDAGYSEKLFALEAGAWYTMTLTAKGTLMTCTLSGGKLTAPVALTFVDKTAAPLAAGSAGLYVAESTAVFEDFRVTSAP
jgi:hypothetical protein